MASHDDVLLAILAGSAGIAGLVLVFLGIVISALQSYEGRAVEPSVLAPYKTAGKLILATFCLSLLSVVLALAGTLSNCEALFWPTLGAFLLQVALLASAGN